MISTKINRIIKTSVYHIRGVIPIKARVYDLNNRFVCEGKAVYRKDEERLYLRANELIGDRGPDFLVHFMDDSQGVFDFRCAYEGYEREGAQFVTILEILETIKNIQRRQDVKVKTNLPVMVTLLEADDTVKIDPSSMKAMQVQAWLRDISAGGIMMETAEPLEINQKLLFPFDKGSSPILLTAEVLREQEPMNDSNYCYGCRYLNNNSGKESIIREYVFRMGAAAKKRVINPNDF